MNKIIVIEEETEDGGFIVSCPSLPGCHSEAETVEEALVNISSFSPFSVSRHYRTGVPALAIPVEIKRIPGPLRNVPRSI